MSKLVNCEPCPDPDARSRINNAVDPLPGSLEQFRLENQYRPTIGGMPLGDWNSDGVALGNCL
jgi:hypothetical protein